MTIDDRTPDDVIDKRPRTTVHYRPNITAWGARVEGAATQKCVGGPWCISTEINLFTFLTYQTFFELAWYWLPGTELYTVFHGAHGTRGKWPRKNGWDGHIAFKHYLTSYWVLICPFNKFWLAGARTQPASWINRQEQKPRIFLPRMGEKIKFYYSTLVYCMVLISQIPQITTL